MHATWERSKFQYGILAFEILLMLMIVSVTHINIIMNKWTIPEKTIIVVLYLVLNTSSQETKSESFNCESHLLIHSCTFYIGAVHILQLEVLYEHISQLLIYPKYIFAVPILFLTNNKWNITLHEQCRRQICKSIIFDNH